MTVRHRHGHGHAACINASYCSQLAYYGLHEAPWACAKLLADIAPGTSKTVQQANASGAPPARVAA